MGFTNFCMSAIMYKRQCYVVYFKNCKKPIIYLHASHIDNPKLLSSYLSPVFIKTVIWVFYLFILCTKSTRSNSMSQSPVQMFVYFPVSYPHKIYLQIKALDLTHSVNVWRVNVWFWFPNWRSTDFGFGMAKVVNMHWDCPQFFFWGSPLSYRFLKKWMPKSMKVLFRCTCLGYFATAAKWMNH